RAWRAHRRTDAGLRRLHDVAECADRAAVRHDVGDQHGRAYPPGLCAHRAAGRLFPDCCGRSGARALLSHRQIRLAGGAPMGWAMTIIPLALLLLGVPIFLLLLTTCITAIVFFSKLPHMVVHQLMFDSLNKFPLIAVPFFIFTGDLM